MGAGPGLTAIPPQSPLMALERHERRAHRTELLRVLPDLDRPFAILRNQFHAVAGEGGAGAAGGRVPRHQRGRAGDCAAEPWMDGIAP